MREIKFRAWDIGQGGHMRQWGDLQQINYNRNWDNKRGDVGWWNDPDFTLMQFTGLRDKNGKEIYEGDVVKSHHDGNSYPVVFGSCELRDDRGEFGGFFDGLIWDGMPFGRDIDGGTDHYEVIGNIYEHKHLLEE